MVAYRPVSSIRRHRKARATALISVMSCWPRSARPPSVIMAFRPPPPRRFTLSGMTTVRVCGTRFRPGACRHDPARRQTIRTARSAASSNSSRQKPKNRIGTVQRTLRRNSGNRAGWRRASAPSLLVSMASVSSTKGR